ncbi:MAG: hypothetical protein M1831_004700 [Alyxoria varia]|nr:MAG: hypothetical protein M1831_004700 [Alyxoria varia]
MAMPLQDCVRRISSHRWLLGNTKVLVLKDFAEDFQTMWIEQGEKIPENLRTHGEYDTGRWWIFWSLRDKHPLEVGFRLQEGFGDTSHRVTAVTHQQITEASSAVWRFGPVYLKVSPWTPDTQPEEDTIRFIAQNVPGAPVPKVEKNSWVEPELGRSFMLLEFNDEAGAPLETRTLQQAWHGLVGRQRIVMAETVAKFVRTLASIVGERFGTVGGRAVMEPYLLDDAASALEPMTISEAHEVLRHSSRRSDSSSTTPVFNGALASLPNTLGDRFYLYNPSLGPDNIILDMQNRVVGILGWECTGYYPRFWVATNPWVAAERFLVEKYETSHGGRVWSKLMVVVLHARGFPFHQDAYLLWKKGMRERGKDETGLNLDIKMEETEDVKTDVRSNLLGNGDEQ